MPSDQFEREVIGERVRDKIAASKRKGIWVGGPVPLGYRSIGKKLEIVPEDAARVRKTPHADASLKGA
jgi:site-specific DNA recombinase